MLLSHYNHNHCAHMYHCCTNHFGFEKNILELKSYFEIEKNILNLKRYNILLIIMFYNNLILA